MTANGHPGHGQHCSSRIFCALFNSTRKRDILTQYARDEEQEEEMTQTNYSREISDAICTRMSEGESLRAICRDPGMPSEGTVRGWAARDVDGFCDRYRSARQLLLEYWSDEIVSIADDGELDPRDRQIRTGVRQWLMSKLAPRRYGDKVQIAGDPESPLQVMHREVSLNDLSDTQLDTLQKFAQSLLIEAQPD